MARFKLLPDAEDDLFKIWEYTVNAWSENQADKYYDMLLAKCQKLASHPFMGKLHDEISDDLFGYHAGEHIIFYSVTSPDEITMIRILHSGMDISRHVKTGIPPRS